MIDILKILLPVVYVLINLVSAFLVVSALVSGYYANIVRIRHRGVNIKLPTFNTIKRHFRWLNFTAAIFLLINRIYVKAPKFLTFSMTEWAKLFLLLWVACLAVSLVGGFIFKIIKSDEFKVGSAVFPLLFAIIWSASAIVLT